MIQEQEHPFQTLAEECLRPLIMKVCFAGNCQLLYFNFCS